MRTIIRGAGTALLGIGYAAGGNRATEAALAAIASPLLETPIDGAKGILLGLTGGPDLSLVEVSEAARVVADAADPEANIIFGATIDPDLEGQVWVTVVAANFTGTRSGPPPPEVPAAAEPSPSPEAAAREAAARHPVAHRAAARDEAERDDAARAQAPREEAGHDSRRDAPRHESPYPGVSRPSPGGGAGVFDLEAPPGRSDETRVIRRGDSEGGA